MIFRICSTVGQFIFKKISKSPPIKMNQFQSAQSFSHSTVDANEVSKFSNNAHHWWTEKNLLTLMNTVRVPLIRDGIMSVNQQTTKGPHPLKGYNILDVGCGGGILSEPLARLGATVTGVDPGFENIEVATEHASKDEEIKHRLSYTCDTVENLVEKYSGTYDAVVCSEVVEHVADIQKFVQCCVALTKTGGSLFFTTINRSMLSYILAIVGAEYVLRVIPRGTHDWNKFVTPEELSELLLSLDCRIVSVEGYMYNPLTKKFSWSGANKTFYGLHALK